MIYMASDQYAKDTLSKKGVENWSGVMLLFHWLAIFTEIALFVTGIILAFQGDILENDTTNANKVDKPAESIDDALSGGEDEDLQNKLQSYKSSKKASAIERNSETTPLQSNK